MIATIVHATFASLPDEWLRESIMARAPPEEIVIALPAEFFESHKEDFLSAVARVTDAIQNKIHELSVVHTRLDVNIVSTQDLRQNVQETVFPTLELMKLSDTSAEHLETQQGNKVKLYTRERAQAIAEEARQFEQEVKKPVAQKIYDDFKANLQVRRGLEERGAIMATPTRLLATRDVRQEQAKDLAKVSAFTVRDYQDSLRRNLHKLGDISERTALNDLNDLLAQEILEKRVQNGENIYYKSSSPVEAEGGVSSPVVSGKAAETAQHMKELYAVPAPLRRIGQFFEDLQQFFSGKNKESTAVESSATTAADGQPALKPTPPSVQDIPSLEPESVPVIPTAPPSLLPPALPVVASPIMQLGFDQTESPFYQDDRGHIVGRYEVNSPLMAYNTPRDRGDPVSDANKWPFGKNDRATPATLPDVVRGISPSEQTGELPPTGGGTGGSGSGTAGKAPTAKVVQVPERSYEVNPAVLVKAPIIKEEVAQSHNPLRDASVASRGPWGRSASSPTIILAVLPSAGKQTVQKSEKKIKNTVEVV
ncbi:MAG: hypothetical protein HY210_02245, partial [Candidatus Omnitrophica bacterium]|nr:hypothetical protein [Candidatus Omnitrophota bacterium]